MESKVELQGDKEESEMRKTTPSHSQTAIPKDNSLDSERIIRVLGPEQIGDLARHAIGVWQAFEDSGLFSNAVAHKAVEDARQLAKLADDVQRSSAFLAQPSTSDVLINPDGGISARPETESSESSSSSATSPDTAGELPEKIWIHRSVVARDLAARGFGCYYAEPVMNDVSGEGVEYTRVHPCSEVKKRAEKVVREWSSLFMGKVANEATYTNLIERIAAEFGTRSEGEVWRLRLLANQIEHLEPPDYEHSAAEDGWNDALTYASEIIRKDAARTPSQVELSTPSDVDHLLFKLAAQDCQHLAAGMNDCTEELAVADWCVVCQAREILQKYNRASQVEREAARENNKAKEA